MVESLLNALWWPWSRSKNVSSSTTIGPPSSKLIVIPTTFTSTLNSIISTAIAPDDDDVDDDARDAPLASSLFPWFTLNNVVNYNLTINDKFNLSLERFTHGSAFNNHSSNDIINYTDFMVATDNDYNWWNCSSCRLVLDSGSAANSSSINQTHVQLDGNESTIYLIQVVVTAFILGIVILATVIGNVFVIAAILLERNLQSVSNHLILSLAVADLLVACLVMPLGAVYEVSREWSLGPELCDMWTSSDVLCCTASILHLVAIALDRYWAVTDIDYAHQRTSKRIGLMILVVWALSFLVSIAPLLGWKDPDWNDRLHVERQCIVSQDIGYQIFATASSFYVPLLVILFLYWRIFLTARKRIRRRQQGKSIVQLMPKPPFIPTPTPSGHSMMPSGSMVAAGGGIAAAVVAVIGRPLPTISETTTQFTTVSSTHTSPEKSVGNGVDKVEPDLNTADISIVYSQQQSGAGPPYKASISNKKKSQSNKAQTESKRERKAAKTLAIITGAFVCCWLPFFILAILLPTCPACNISPFIMSLCLWLGYFNSTLNPIIYTIFSPEFRHAFKRILCGRRHSNRHRRHLGVRHLR